MATEIIPKPKIKKRAFPLSEISYYLVVLVLIASFLAYFACDYFEKKSQTELEHLKAAILEKQSLSMKQLEGKVLGAKEKIETFAEVFASYQKSSRLFELIQAVCHPKVFFFQTKVDIENAKVFLWGHTDTFQDLREQVLILEDEPKIHNLNLSQIKIGDEGGLDFEISFSFNPETLKEF